MQRTRRRTFHRCSRFKLYFVGTADYLCCACHLLMYLADVFFLGIAINITVFAASRSGKGLSTDLEFVVQCFNVIFHSLNELCLIFAYRSLDMWPHEQRVEPRENTEHFASIFRRSQLIAKSRCYTRFNSVDSFFISRRVKNGLTKRLNDY